MIGRGSVAVATSRRRRARLGTIGRGAVRVAMVGAVVTALACASSPPEGGDASLALVDRCAPVEGELAGGASLRGHAGVYHLVMRGGSGGSSSGALRLRVLPRELQSMGGAATPLSGSTDLDPSRVGAMVNGAVSSEDPGAPGVLVIESGSRIILRLGDQANRRDVSSFDGAFTVLIVQRIDSSGFAGAWRSASDGDEVDGHFCAERQGEP